MNEIIKYINEHKLDSIVNAILNSNKDISKVIQSIKESRVEYQTKSQRVQDILIQHQYTYKVGMVVEAQEQYGDNFRRGKSATITELNGGVAILDYIIDVKVDDLRRYFKVMSE